MSELALTPFQPGAGHQIVRIKQNFRAIFTMIMSLISQVIDNDEKLKTLAF